ncbi:MAG TPA: tetratricopeptide repeat protein [Polyangiaceae bacterium]|jgi:tetratricopeptide (TPR) repeat protein|nr:tetratricopeptide repeat protein [Polyangiaceae bacterium]
MSSGAGSGAAGKAGDWLQKATRAESSVARAKYATRGLAAAGRDRTLRAMLLRQLYLSQMESEQFGSAADTAREILELNVLPDVAAQDLARAQLALGEPAKAIEELRRASRVGPASRRAFHLWTLGTVLYFREDHAGAASAFERAVRWGTTARPLYRAQLLLARLGQGRRLSARALAAARQELEAAACGQGYGRYVLGELAHRQGDVAAARAFLEEFSARSAAGRAALRVSLASELARARQLLSALEVEEIAKV